ncbi:hypothetical protein L228DRAFT_262970 [Xylona heveae TC161]|uniref:Conserved oligomeric Golgi complex subunit 2 n=1 Tax=Xylona heveae (strain CBS 132557 / TC161) TaxID=1328760 RepID=A0A165ADN0_XYLHT|nr:hypothetical protein L228DRAFT_262970 [Xylona heveae TC161]KZF20305.1 hypothetical protein L228DRAFT_262970 [Xylona heveae TC161]
MSRFYFGDTDSSSGLEDDDLPYPAPLARADFLQPDFSPAEYLSTLRNRHQTLEDLRGDLRSRSQLVSKELLDLVNSNYTDFLSLGGSLRGGDEKVEEVRVGLLGFKRDIEDVRKRVEKRGKEVEDLIRERTGLRRQINVGRALLEVDSRLTELEGRLMVKYAGQSSLDDETAEAGFTSESEEDSDEEEYSEDNNGSLSIAKLKGLVQRYLYVTQLIDHIGSEHPFLIAQESRLMRVRNTILLDLGTALKHAKTSHTKSPDRLMKIMAVYREMGEAKEAVQALKDLKLKA